MKLRRVQPLLICLLGVAFGRSAWGQTTQVVTNKDVVVGYQGLPTKVPPNTDSGFQVSDDVLLHLGLGVEAGYDTNVFYAPTAPQGSAILRIVPFAELTNATRTGVAPSGVFFDLGASLNYRQYLSGKVAIRDQSAVMPGASAALVFGSNQSLSLMLGDGYNRIDDPPYVANQQAFIRDVNVGFAQLAWSPGGGRLGVTLRYTNTIDYFEDQQLQLADNMAHDLMLDVSWRWLPKTALFVNVHQGYISYFHSDEGKANSLPLRATVGLRGLITNKLSLMIAVGYGNGFYQTADPDPANMEGARPVAGPTGFRGDILVSAEATYRPTLETAVTLGYSHDFQNAILGDFYYLDSVYLNFSQAIAGRLGFGFSARYESRSFQDIPIGDMMFVNEHDNYWQVGANLDYRIRGSLYAGVAYTLQKNDSPYVQPSETAPATPNYTKQLIFARAGVTY
jgi:hypothetical protein